MSKKFLSLALALAMCLGLTVPAFAAEEKLKVTITFDGYLRTEYVKGDGENEFMAVQVVKDGSNVKLECPGAEGLAVEDEYERELEVTCLQYTKGAGWAPGSAEPFLDGLSQDSGVIIDASTKTFTATSADADSSIFVIGFRPRFDTFYDDSRFDVEEIYWMSESGYAQLVPEHKGVPGAGSEIVGTVGPDKPTQPTVTTVGGFTDVKTGDYFADPVLWAVEKKITAGTSATTFAPNATCTQSQILTFLWRAKGEPKPTGTVSGTQYYATAAQWAKEQGLTDNFSAEADCTRAMVVTYLWKLAGSPKTGTSNFTDVSANADYAQAVAWAVEQDITSGTGNGQFSPNSTCTRGQIVTFLYRAFAK